MESLLELTCLNTCIHTCLKPECESESGFEFECGGGSISLEFCGNPLIPHGAIAAWSH